MARQVRNDQDLLGVSRILNLPNATTPGEPVNLSQMNSAIEGLGWKDNVRVSTIANLNLASPGASINGVAMAANDRVLVKSQTTPAQNGIYIWNGAAVAMTRALDASTSDEMEDAITTVDEGSDAGTTWRQTQVNFTLDSGSVVWTPFGTAAPGTSETVPGLIEVATQAEVDAGTDDARAVTPAKLAAWSGRLRKVSANIGDGTATQIDVTHNLNTRDVQVEVYRNATPWDTPDCDVERPDVNTVRLRFATGLAPTAAQFRVVIEG